MIKAIIISMLATVCLNLLVKSIQKLKQVRFNKAEYKDLSEVRYLNLKKGVY